MTPAAILAAGRSSRMARLGRPKALLPLGDQGETFLSRLIKTLADTPVEDIIVVLGHEAAAIRQAFAPPERDVRDLRNVVGVRFVENRAYDRGQLSSLLTALDLADRPGVRGLLVMLVDAPLVSAPTVRAVLSAHRASGAPVVRPVKEGRHGHPVLFDRAVFDELRRADPAAGAKAVVRAHLHDLLDVEVEDEGAFIDIDTPEAYERIIGRPGSGT